MLVRREYYIAAGKCVCGLDVIPILEVLLAAGGMSALQTCVATVRPLGFAILTSDNGYWLVSAQDLNDLAHAIADCTSEAWAS